MNIEGAWKRGYTGKNIVVTILDDGIERTHPDLIQNYVSTCWVLDSWVIEVGDHVLDYSHYQQAAEKCS